MNRVVHALLDYLLDPHETSPGSSGAPFKSFFTPTPSTPSPPPPDISGRDRETPTLDPKVNLARSRAALAALMEQVSLGNSGLTQEQEEGLASLVGQAMVKLRWATQIYEPEAR